MAVDISNGGLNFGSSLDPAGFLRGAKIIEQSNARLVSALESSNKKASDIGETMAKSAKEAASGFSTLEKGIAGLFAASQIQSFVSQVISVRGEFQQLSSAFNVMLGSKEKADKLMGEAVKLAAITPFGLQDVANGAKQLLAYGFAADSVTQQLTDLGNIASGVGAPLGDIVYLYGTLKASGRVTQMDINQFAGRGIPIYEELAKVMGVTTDAVRNLVSSGKVGFPQIEQAFGNMTGEGGRFFNLMQEQSKSLTGQIANLGDAWDMMLNDIGKSSEGILSGATQGAIGLVEHYEEIGKALGVLIAAYGTYRAALALQPLITATATASEIGMTGAQVTRIAVTEALTAASAKLNAVLLANPYVLLAAATVGTVAAIIAFSDNTTAAERAQRQSNDAIEKGNKLLEDRKSRYKELTSVLNDNNSSEFVKIKAFEELQALYPTLFKNLTKEEFLKKNIADLDKSVNSANDDSKVALIGQQAEEASKRAEALVKQLQNINSLGNQGGGMPSARQLKESIEAAKNEASRLTIEFEKQKEVLKLSKMTDAEKLEYYKKQRSELENQRNLVISLNGGAKNAAAALKLWDISSFGFQLNEAKKQIDYITGKIKGVDAGPETITSLDAKIKKIKENQEGSKNNSEFKSYQKEIDELEKKKRAITGEADKSTEKSAVKTVKIEEDFAEKRKAILKKITEAQQQAQSAALGMNAKEIADNKAKYKAITDEMLAYNEKAKKAGKPQIAKAEFKKVENLEKTEEETIIYKQQTAQQQIEFEKQKNLYADFEAYKTAFGEAAARQRYGTEVKNAKQLIEAQAKTVAALSVKASVGGGLNENERVRFEQAKKNVEELQALEDKRFAEALKSAQTYTQKAAQINEDFEKQKKDLYDATNGNVTEEQYRILEEQKNAKLRALNEENAYAQSGYADLMENMLGMTKEAVLQRLAIIKQGYENNKTLTPKQKQTLIAGVDDQISKLDGSQNDPFAKAIKSVKEYKKAVKDSEGQTSDTSEKSKAMFGAIGGAIDGAGAIFGSVTGALQGLGIGTDKYTQATLKNVEGLLGGMGNLAKGIASGNPVDIVKGSIEILTNAIELFNKKDKKLEKQIDGYKANLAALQKSYADLDKAVQNSVGESIYSDQASQIENLKRQQQELIKARDAESQKKKKDQGKIDEYNRQIDEIPGKIEEIQNAISQNLIQGTFKDLSNALADALTDAFKSGEDGMAAMDKSFNAFIGNAIKNSLKLKLIEPIIAGLTKDLVDYAKGNGNSIVGFDFSKYKSDLQNAGKTFTDALNANKEFFEDAAKGAGKQGELSKGIQGITETTANRLEAEFGGLRLAQLQLVSITQTNHSQIMAMNTQKLNSLIQIEINTRGTKENTDHLSPIRTALESIDKKTSDTNAKLRGGGII